MSSVPGRARLYRGQVCTSDTGATPSRLAIDRGSRTGRCPALAGVLDNLHGRPGAAAVAAPFANQVDLVMGVARILGVVLAGLRKGQERPVSGNYQHRDAISMIPVLAGDEDVNPPDWPLGRLRRKNLHIKARKSKGFSLRCSPKTVFVGLAYLKINERHDRDCRVPLRKKQMFRYNSGCSVARAPQRLHAGG